MEKFKHICDGVAFCSGAITIMGYLPTILGVVASSLSILWYLLRFYEWYKNQQGIVK